VTKQGLPSSEVRSHYNARLEEWAQTASSFRANLTRVDLELPKRNDSATCGDACGLRSLTAATSPCRRCSSTCRLAEAGVLERHSARVEARLRGSAVLHCYLIFRDLWVYRSFDAFSPEAMMKLTRHKLIARGKKASPSDFEVCDALVESASRSSAAFNDLAESLGEQAVGYTKETIFLYLYPALAIVFVVYLIEVWRRGQRVKSNH